MLMVVLSPYRGEQGKLLDVVKYVLMKIKLQFVYERAIEARKDNTKERFLKYLVRSGSERRDDENL